MDYVKFIRSKVGHEKIIMNASSVIIRRGEKILLQKRADNGNWGLVGGIMEIGETYREGALREALEETGLNVKLDFLVGIYHNPEMMWPSGDKAHVICAVFAGHCDEGEPRTDSESLEFRFFGKDELPYIDSIDHRQAVMDYFDGKTNNIH